MKYVGILALLLTGCTGLIEMPELESRQVAEETSLASDSAQSEAITYAPQEPVARWWQQFDDARLHALIEAGFAHNKDIDIAIARVLEARALQDQRQFDYFPTVTADANYTRRRFNSAQFGGQGGNAAILGTYEAGLNASWEADLLGRVSSRVKAAQAQAAASRADLENAYVIVSSDIATNYMALRGAQQRLAIAQRNEANQERTLELTDALFEGGRASKLDTSRAQAQLQLTRATIPPLQGEISALIRRLSVLTGRTPDALTDTLKEVAPLPSLPVMVDIGDVSSLLQRRPDIRAARENIAQATAELNLANTELFPTVNLLGSVGYLASSLSTFGTSATLIASIVPTLNWRAFDLGRVYAEIDAADARGKAAIANYEQAVLLALEDTQNALENFTRAEMRRAELEKAAAAAQEAAEIANLRFEYGADDFLSVLDAERTQLEAEDALAQSNIAAATNLVAIYRALAGGWQAVDINSTLKNAAEQPFKGVKVDISAEDGSAP